MPNPMPQGSVNLLRALGVGIETPQAFENWLRTDLGISGPADLALRNSTALWHHRQQGRL